MARTGADVRRLGDETNRPRARTRTLSKTGCVVPWRLLAALGSLCLPCAIHSCYFCGAAVLCFHCHLQPTVYEGGGWGSCAATQHHITASQLTGHVCSRSFNSALPSAIRDQPPLTGSGAARASLTGGGRAPGQLEHATSLSLVMMESQDIAAKAAATPSFSRPASRSRSITSAPLQRGGE